MKILITGGCGFVGATLARSLLARGQLAGRALGTLVLADQADAPADLRSDPRVQVRIGPLLDQCAALHTEAFDGVFHLASAVSGECELDFDLGMRSNLDSTRALLDALRAAAQAGGTFKSSRGVQPGPAFIGGFLMLFGSRCAWPHDLLSYLLLSLIFCLLLCPCLKMYAVGSR
jgi:nucleoside-diphosphate-sugar epimerase